MRRELNRSTKSTQPLATRVLKTTIGPMSGHFIKYGQLCAYLENQFSCGLHSVHGPNHWRRVEQNGLYLARLTDADEDVVTLFAMFHDSRRLAEGDDPDHGRRGAEMAESCRGKDFEMEDAAFELLHYACCWHTHEDFSGDNTIGPCWDADRLDLVRVGITPDPDYMSTDPGKQIAYAGGIEEYLQTAEDNEDC